MERRPGGRMERHPHGVALRERGIIVRVSATALVLVNSTLLVVALLRPETFGLSRTAIVALGVPHLAVEAVIAMLPWQRLLPERPRPWLLRGHVAYNVAGLVAALALAEGAATQALWLMAFNIVYSALILPLREHVVVVAATLTGALAALVLAGEPTASTAVDLVSLGGIGLLATIGGDTVWSALGRAEAARIEAADSAAALHDALVAVHATSTGDVDEILRTAVQAAVRSPQDMAAAYLDEGDGTRAVFAGVPEELAVDEPEQVRGIIAGIAERGPAVLDFADTDGDLLPDEVAGRLRASMVVPVRHRGSVIGALTVARTSGPLFSSGEQAALELLADHVARGVALSHELRSDRAALERLREIDRLKRDFVATVSHEMRTPLTVISGLAETLRHRRLDEGMRTTVVTRLQSNAATLERIVTGLLDAAGIDRGIVAVQQEDVDLTTLLRDTAARLESLFDEHELVVEVADGLHCGGDPNLLERVLENLLTNAQRHTPSGTTVRLRGSVTRGGLLVEVADDGPGIPEEDLELVMGRFVRGGEPNERSTRGLGLGLALADEVLRLHGAELEVESAEGAGTTFRFTLAPLPVRPVTPSSGS